jgi:hypothetical protein
MFTDIHVRPCRIIKRPPFLLARPPTPMYPLLGVPVQTDGRLCITYMAGAKESQPRMNVRLK